MSVLYICMYTYTLGSVGKPGKLVFNCNLQRREFSDPGRGVAKLIFNCNLQHLGVFFDPGRGVGKIIFNCIYSIWKFSDAGRGVGKLIFHCDSKHVRVFRPMPCQDH